MTEESISPPNTGVQAEEEIPQFPGLHFESPIVDTPIGKLRRPSDLTRKEWIYLLVAGLSLVLSLVVTIWRMATVPKSSADFTFALALIINILFCMGYVFGGVFSERPYELLIFVLATLGLQLYLILNIAIGVKTPAKWVRLGASLAAFPLLVILGGLLVREYMQSGKLIFRTVGALEHLQDACKTMFKFFACLKLDFQLTISIVILIMSDGANLDTLDIVVLAIAGPVTFACGILGYVSIRLERKYLFGAYAFVMSLLTAFAVYMIYQSTQVLKANKGIPGKQSLVGVTITCAILCLIMRPLLLFFGGRAAMDFGKGLSQKVWTKGLLCFTVNSD